MCIAQIEEGQVKVRVAVEEVIQASQWALLQATQLREVQEKMTQEVTQVLSVQADKV